MSSSQGPTGPMTRTVEKPVTPNAPHIPSKLSSSFTPADENNNNNNDSVANTPKKPALKGADGKSDIPPGSEKLSGAELKKRAKAEKAERRAKEREEREQAGGLSGNQTDKDKNKKADMTPKKQGRIAVAPLPVPESKKKKEPVNEKVYAPFAHLSDHLRKGNIEAAGKDVHPRVLTAGIQMRDYELLGSAVRLTSMLLAFKKVIMSYETPEGTSLARHLTAHLSHQIDFIKSCRPLSISQGNAIRALKLAISQIDPMVPEKDAKMRLYEWIDIYINEKIVAAHQIIAFEGQKRIKHGDVILVFGGGNVICRALLCAKANEKKFRVIIVDSRPIFEGKFLAERLMERGIDVEYTLVTGLNSAMKNATKVMLGAHAMVSNGALYSRVGNALVAMAAKDLSNGRNVPVIVLCETVKFSDRSYVDSVVVNELANPDQLIVDKKNWDFPPRNEGNALENWKEIPSLKVLNLMYDVTQAKNIDLVITEMGNLPSSAVPTVHRISTETEEPVEN